MIAERMIPVPTRVFVGVPTYDMRIDARTAQALFRATKHRQAIWRPAQSSLLAECFNRLLADGIASGCDYFCLLHADIIPGNDWLDVLLDEMERTGADVLSAVAPIKDERGLSSTSIDRGDDEDPWKHRRLTMTEVFDLPETFSTQDIPWSDNRALLVNTGCWIAHLRRPWVKKFPGFTIEDRLSRDPCAACQGDRCQKCGGHGFLVKIHVHPEDWNSSRWFHANHYRVMATRKVKLLHAGGSVYTNASPWGQWKVDETHAPHLSP